MSTGGTGVVADEVSVIAGTSSSASTTPSIRPATADGRLSMSFSRHSCPAAERGGTPSAASSAFSARRWRTPAAMLTQKPVMASTAAAMATTSSACCGTVDSGSLSNPAATPAALVMSDPGGRSPASPAGTADGPLAPPEVASHHWFGWAGDSELLLSTSCSRPRSTSRAPPLTDTVGNVVTAPTIFTDRTAPLTSACTTDPTLALVAARNRWVAMPGSAATGGVPVRVSSPPTGVGGCPGGNRRVPARSRGRGSPRARCRKHPWP